ncbi:putative ATP synthase F0, A subunit [Gleimia coleocanis DSM 15436]|uniref:Putative ATP synthase F0, A subunit n=1 Tax=Gleimia coleocanis DSM 15436 TaxID=525245 RepID=C0W134_9ACTO|nr:ABC transporter ATP-binding protein [Gleimia coleocanis]EEH63523.1 putative ATP synthase F0, A subunit [Gleimia coleocanis DSM 15436]
MRSLLKRLNQNQRASLTLVVGLIICQVWFDLKIPDYMADIAILTQTPGNHLEEIWRIGALMLLCALGSILSSLSSAYIVERTAAGFSRSLRHDLFTRVNSFSAAEINKFSTASLITRSTNDVSQVQMLISSAVWSLVRGPVMVILAVTKIAGKGDAWLTVTALAVFTMAALLGLMLRLVIPRFKQMQEFTDDISRVTREHLVGLPVVHATNSQKREEEKFALTNQRLTSATRFTGLSFSTIFPMIFTTVSLLTVAIYWVGAQLIDGATEPEKLQIFSDMVVFSNYTMQIMMAFMVMSMVLFIYPRASVAAGRIKEVLETEPSIADTPAGTAQKQPIQAGEIEFRNVTFRFPDASEDALENINLQILPGQTVGIIGATGSGKTSLVNLIARFYDTTGGQVLIDGQNVKDLALEELYEKLGYVTQQAVLFKGTIASNVSYGIKNTQTQEETEKRIYNALEIAQVSDFVSSQADGIETEIAQAGKNVSGGQKQRLAIARAIAKQPQILIFDDSFSALDYRTDRQVRNELKKHTADVTTLIVAQRVGSIRDADQIIVMDNGHIVGQGTHQELMHTCDVYQEIANSQLSVAELEGE